jgi:hypothetical protein
MSEFWKSPEETTQTFYIFALICGIIYIAYKLTMKRFEKNLFRMFYPTSQADAEYRQKCVKSQIFYDAKLTFLKDESFFCNCKIFINFDKIPYGESGYFQSVGKTEKVRKRILSKRYIVPNYSFTDYEAHQKFESFPENLTQSQPKEEQQPSFFNQVIKYLFMTLFLFPNQILRGIKGLANYIDKSDFSIKEEKYFRERFPLFMEFYLPCKLKTFKLNGVTLNTIFQNGRLYIDDRFLKKGSKP